MDAGLLLTDDLSTLSDDRIKQAVVTFSAHMNAAEFRLVHLVGELDQRSTRGVLDGASICQWLGFYCGLDGNAARERVRIARALRELPQIRACFAEGKISYSKVRAITRVAHPRNEHLLLSYALNATAAQMERVVRGYRRVERLDDPEAVLRQRRRRGLRWWFDDEGMLVIEGRLPPEDGALFIRAVEAVCERMKEDERADDAEDPKVRMHGEVDAEAESPNGARRADALMEIVQAGLGNVDAELPGGDRTLVVMHVPVTGAEDAPGIGATPPCPSSSMGASPSSGRCELEDGPILPDETARRVACDASLVVHREHPDGRVASIGRRSRTVPYWLRRALKHRDGGCRFPGCDRTRHVDAHHVVHWAEGGETSLDNLVLLCRHHHRLIHEHRFHIRRGEEGAFVFDTMDGRCVPNVFPQKPGSCGVLVHMNQRRGIEIDARTGTTGSDYTPRPDFGAAVAALQELKRATPVSAGTPSDQAP